MKKKRHAQSGLVPESRWLTYATASLATSLAGAGSTDAAVHYSGPLNIPFESPGYGAPARQRFSLNGGSAHFQLANIIWSNNEYGEAGFGITAPVSAKFAGRFSGFRYVSKLASGDHLSTQHFIRNGIHRGVYPPARNRLGLIVYYYYNYGQWHQLETGFIGFKFNTGAGVQYGWVRLHLEPGKKGAFTLIDYAYADAGEGLTAGQTSSNTQTAALGSLGLLALGGIGLEAWRQQKAQEKTGR